MVVRFDPFTVDVPARQLSRDGVPIHLTPKAFDLLALLIAEAPRVVPKTELHARLWPDAFVSDATLVGVVKEVRRVLADDDPSAPIVRTVHRVGYAFGRAVSGRPGSGRTDTGRSASDGGTRGAGAVSRTRLWLTVGAQRFELGDGTHEIGRDPGVDVWIDAVGVSRRHARITVRGGTATVEDLGSKNGTFVDGHRVDAPVTLAEGARIQVGTVDLTYRVSHPEGVTETQIVPGRAR